MIPVQVKLNKAEGSLTLGYADGSSHTLSGEYLRVHSPSAEVRGHGPGQEILQWGKKSVRIASLEKAGNYAVRISFDDGHDTGLYSWTYLYDLCVNRDKYWQAYVQKLHDAGRSRDPDVQIVKLM